MKDTLIAIFIIGGAVGAALFLIWCLFDFELGNYLADKQGFLWHKDYPCVCGKKFSRKGMGGNLLAYKRALKHRETCLVWIKLTQLEYFTKERWHDTIMGTVQTVSNFNVAGPSEVLWRYWHVKYGSDPFQETTNDGT